MNEETKVYERIGVLAGGEKRKEKREEANRCAVVDRRLPPAGSGLGRSRQINRRSRRRTRLRPGPVVFGGGRSADRKGNDGVDRRRRLRGQTTVDEKTGYGGVPEGAVKTLGDLTGPRSPRSRGRRRQRRRHGMLPDDLQSLTSSHPSYAPEYIGKAGREFETGER